MIEKDALESLFAKQSEADRFQVLELPGPYQGVLARTADGEAEYSNHGAPLSVQCSLESLLAAMGDEVDAMVLVSHTKVLATVHPRRLHPDYFTATLQPTAAWLALLSWWKESAKPSQIVDWLRGPLADTVSDNVLPIFQRIDFGRVSGHSRQHDSLGRTLEVKAQASAGELPKSLAFKLPVFRESLSAVSVQMSVQSDPVAEVVGLQPISDSLLDGLDSAIEMVAASIASKVACKSLWCRASREDLRREP